MSIVIQIKDGNRYTLWNVTQIHFTEKGVTVEHSDRPVTVIDGYVESIKRR